ncbi:bifunctional diguanylate cyclase/phosphodiesterase [Rhodoferax sp.]|uniref:putative bifunctional diguanylate cyclase/phosphodiesterase n=1 Tax=Rhodoferax sp. TaxID=50421 RepID=UPI002ACE2084|nr:bifunctional diguanylate cyclase/phosphodiesterase [Rhodoferax sp.]MDZ7919750.1 bifunctional diguanylate cyclase/phosphodiesterase [Rhodoferax sp.]
MNTEKLMGLQADSDTLHFLEDEAVGGSAKEPVWRLLVVDDEPDVHRATTFALAGVRILGRALQFLHAYSASEASKILNTERDVAVVLLDVVMEREDAGLALVKTIRQDLRLSELRIILRTGQPGYAPEIETIHDFDINDYKTKSELTRTKLYATVTAALRAYEQIRKLDELAFYDRLSCLPNRNKFIDLAEERLKNQPAADDVIAILDIDDFSEINDALGHQQGDRLLQSVADRLKVELGPEVILARIGSDTFGLMGEQSVVNPLRVLAMFREPFQVQDDSMVVTATMGLTKLLSDGVSGRDALKDANIALKRAKKSRRGSFVMFSSEMGSDIRERVRLLQSLRSAVESERLFIVYQPQINLNSGQVVGMEALIRWRNEDGTFVPPDRFIPLAEASGMIIAIGDWVLRMSCHELGRLQAMGLTDLRMSVNVSQIQFRHPEFLDKLNAALLDTGIRPNCLELEITESVAMEDADFMLETLNLVRELGISIAIDDFGTGYSSLSQLRQLPIDRLKIDRAFVSELQKDMCGGHIASMVIELGRNLNLTVIAEGIEDEAQAQALRALGCHEGQGYLYAKPMTPPLLKEWLIARGCVA